MFRLSLTQVDIYFINARLNLMQFRKEAQTYIHTHTEVIRTGKLTMKTYVAQSKKPRGK